MSLLKYSFGAKESGPLAPLPVDDGKAVTASGGSRARVGLTGLAAIFLLVLVAAAGLRPEATATAREPLAEPLAVLGVAPGAAPATAPAARTVPAAPART
ncbi:MAG: hypothetical protein ACOYLS_08665 [Polymorphobacter sp.]